MSEYMIAVAGSACLVGIGAVLGSLASLMVRHGDFIPLAGMLVLVACWVAAVTVLPWVRRRADREARQ